MRVMEGAIDALKKRGGGFIKELGGGFLRSAGGLLNEDCPRKTLVRGIRKRFDQLLQKGGGGMAS